MYEYENAGMFGLGASKSALEIAAMHFRNAPTPGFPYAFRNREGNVVYASEAGAAVLRQDPSNIELKPWYKDPLILGGGALVVGIIIFGVFWS